MSTTSTNFLASLGAGSGIDSKALATGLATAETQPQKDLVQAKITKTENKISGYGAVLASLNSIKTAFQSLENPSSVITKTTSSSQPNAVEIVAGAGAVVGAHSVQVTQLAQAQRSISNGFASATTPLNGGNAFTLQLAVHGGTPKTIRIPALATTPEGMALAINSAGLGLTASLVNTSDGSATPYKLVVSGATGAAQDFTLTSDDGSGTGEAQTLTFGPATANGTIKVAGVSVSVLAGETADQVAVKVSNALNADSMVTGTPGRAVTVGAVGSGSVVFQYAASDGYVNDIVFNAGETGVTYGVAESSAFTTGSPVTGVTLTPDATHPAQDALLAVDGIVIQRATNSISDVYTGVTLNLLSTTATPAQVAVGRDSSELSAKLNELVTAYNNAISDFKILKGPANTKDPTDVYSGSLQSDSTVSYVISTLKTMFLRDSSTTSGDVNALRDLGVSFQRDGTLAFDETIMTAALDADPDAVVTMLTADRENKTYYGVSNRGLAGDAIKTLNDMIATTGQINQQTTNANAQLSKYKDQLAALEDRYNLILTRYITQFAAMDSYVGQVNSLKTSLTSTFAGMMAQYTNKN